MNLSVAVWMDQDAVLCVVCPTKCFIHNVVVVPSRYLGNRMATDWADASLFLPEIHQSSSSLQGLFHLYAQAFFKIEFPCRIVGVAIPFDLGVLSDGCCGSQAQPVLDGFTTLLFCRAEEAPVLVSESAKIPVLHPLLALLWMSPFCPSPQYFEDGSIYTDKGFLGICVSVIVRPSPYCGVECRYQPVCCSLFVILNDFSDVRKERFHVLLRRFNKELPVILTYMLPEKVKSLLDVRYPGFLFREFQSSWLQICDHEGFDFVFQDLFRVSCYDEVIREAHQVDLLILAFCRPCSGVRELLAKYPLQPIKCHVGKDGRDDTALRRAIFRRVEDGFVHVSCFQPFLEDGFLHRDMAQQPGVTDFVEAGFDVPFQDPLWCGAIGKHRVTLYHCIGTASFLPEPIRVWVGLCFGNGVQGLQVQGLHCSVLHCRDTQRPFLPMRLRDIHPSQRQGFVAFLLHLVYGHPLFFRVFPGDVIDARGVLALVFCHSSYGKSLAAERMGQQVLQGLHLVPLTGLRCLNDTRLQPTHRLVDRLPWDGMPVCREVGGSTSRSVRRHLHRPLDRFLKVSRPSTPQGSLPACASGDVATRIRPATGRPSLFPTPIPAPPLVGLTAFLPSRKERYGLTTFRKVDRFGLGALYSPITFRVHDRVKARPCARYSAILAQACQHL